MLSTVVQPWVCLSLSPPLPVDRTCRVCPFVLTADWCPAYCSKLRVIVTAGVVYLAAGARATGAGMGFVFGIFLGAMGDMQPLQMVNGREVPQAPLREQVIYTRTASSWRHTCW